MNRDNRHFNLCQFVYICLIYIQSYPCLFCMLVSLFDELVSLYIFKNILRFGLISTFSIFFFEYVHGLCRNYDKPYRIARLFHLQCWIYWSLIWIQTNKEQYNLHISIILNRISRWISNCYVFKIFEWSKLKKKKICTFLSLWRGWKWKKF